VTNLCLLIIFILLLCLHSGQAYLANSLYEDYYQLLILVTDLSMNPVWRLYLVSLLVLVYQVNLDNSSTQLNNYIFSIDRFTMVPLAQLYKWVYYYDSTYIAEFLITYRDYYYLIRGYGNK
jgi:hypothetical protein